MRSKPLPKKFLDFNVKLQKEMALQAKEHPKLPQKYVMQISADHVKLEMKGKKKYG